MRAIQALALFSAFALYFSSPLSPLKNLQILERFSIAPILVLAFVTAGLCYFVGWRQYSGGILIVVAVFSLALKVGNVDDIKHKIEETQKAVSGIGSDSSHIDANSIPLAPGAQEIWVSDTQPIWRIPLYANARSGWIHLIEGRPFKIESSGSHVILTWDGRKYNPTPGTSTWHGDIPSSVISLMGTGEAIVSQ